jgi:proline iminopeptidase
MTEGYWALLDDPDPAVRRAAAAAWNRWEGVTVTLLPSAETVDHMAEGDNAVATARIENHYFRHQCWLREGELLERAAATLRGIPGIIVQGRHDCCTPPAAAWALKKAWPEVELQIVPDGSHLFSEPGITDGLVRATDRFAGRV